jgi:AcrR family transcriptional regulator
LKPQNIIESEGIKSIRARNIANQAGYSYATLNNYFKNIKELVFYCVQDFQKEGVNFVNEKIAF